MLHYLSYLIDFSIDKYYAAGDYKMNRITYKNKLTLLAVLVMLMATLLTACGSQAAAPSTEAETTKVETAKAEETEPAAPAEVEEVVEAEPTAEPTPEPVVYEGIDMESTLPGAEWLQTFDGIINEVKFVIFNDETNKKIILENGQEAEFLDTDTFAIYYPQDKKIIEGHLMEKPAIFRDNSGIEQARFYYDIRKDIKDGDKSNVSQRFEVDGEEVELTATLVIKKSE